jgi:hypothetical protein
MDAVLAAPANRRSQIEARKKQVIDSETMVRAVMGAIPKAKLAAPTATIAKAHCARLAPAFAERFGSRLARPRLASHNTVEAALARTSRDICAGVVIARSAEKLSPCCTLAKSSASIAPRGAASQRLPSAPSRGAMPLCIERG